MTKQSSGYFREIPQKMGKALTTLAQPLCLASAILLGSPAAGEQKMPDPADTPPKLYRIMMVGGTGSGELSGFRLYRDGSLEKLPWSPMEAGFGFQVITSPDARRVYVGSLIGKRITAYDLGPDGSLTPIENGVTQLDASVVVMTITPDGTRMYVTAGLFTNEIHSFDITETGTLEPTGAEPVKFEGESILGVSHHAITPNTRFLYLVSPFTDKLRAYRIDTDGSITQIGEPIRPGSRPVLPAVTPDGRFLYVTHEGSGDIAAYSIGPDGQLTPVPGQPYPVGHLAHGAVFSADGRRLYVPSTKGIAGFQVGQNGSLTPLPGSPYPIPEGSIIGRVVFTPDGRHLFAVDVLTTQWNTRIHHYQVNADGSLAAFGKPVNTETLFSDGPGSIITPNQGPTAHLCVLEHDGFTVTFSAAGSTDSDGIVSHYEWDFGDGSTISTTTPVVTHTYETGSDWFVKLKVTDDEGCSDKQDFTGLILTCNGSNKAIAGLRTGDWR